MHYIRLLRAPVLEVLPKGRSTISLLLTITTDLGDTFLYPQQPIQLDFWLKDEPMQLKPVDPSSASWKPSMRVLKTKLALDKHWSSKDTGLLTISPSPHPSLHIALTSSAQLLPWHDAAAPAGTCNGLIAPLTVRVSGGTSHPADIAIRDIVLASAAASTTMVSIEEDMGESIARHIWDAGLVTAALFADACWNERNPLAAKDLLPLGHNRSLNILELGCGVGVLGISMALLMPHILKSLHGSPKDPYILMTDLPEAEERATSNISRCQNSPHWTGPKSRLEYENLDWDDGSKGTFGPKASEKCWDVVILSDCTYNVDVFPLLVTTLSAIHTHNRQILKAGDTDSSGTVTKVLMSTKPRHDSERALFNLLKDECWDYRLEASIPMLKINEEDEAVEIYAITKGNTKATANSLKRKGSDAVDVASKKASIEPSK